MAKLILIFEDVAIREYPLARQEMLIGRSPVATIALEDSTVSGRHAVLESEISRDRAQRFYLRDLKSKNGTYVAGKRISRAPLADGDEFRIGWSTFRFQQSDMAPAQSA
ncbi:FHA domain-containing protein [Granulosicoccaceae sp. 1_MG-2023]|nr:FHA domain-containing protein [Granulosicoccaceae sp. 1_MG-2023]